MSLIPFVGAVQKFNRDRGYRIERSLRFNSADSAYLNRTPASAGNRKTWTWSGWVKIGKLSVNRVLFSAGTTSTYLRIFSGDTIGYGVSGVGNFESTGKLRDPSAWYHIVYKVDTTAASNRVTIYVNNSVFFQTDAGYSLNADTTVNSAVVHAVGRDTESNIFYNDGYLAEVHFIDGQALTPSSFGEFNSDTGVWQPIKYAGTYGTNGFYLNFSDNSGTTSTTLGKDSSGNGNNWTPNNFSVTAGAGNDSLVDSPTRYGTDTGAGGEVRGNYPTWNPLSPFTQPPIFTDGNLTIERAASGVQTIGPTLRFPESGKYYCEYDIQVVSTNFRVFVSGINSAYFATTGNITVNGSSVGTYATYGASDVIGIAVNIDDSEISFYKNGSLQVTSSYTDSVNTYAVTFGTTGDKVTINFGQRPFSYTAPSGFKALVTTNLL